MYSFQFFNSKSWFSWFIKWLYIECWLSRYIPNIIYIDYVILWIRIKLIQFFQAFYDLDTELTYTCVPGYKRIDGFQGAQCFFFNGTARWFGPDLTCHPIDCKRPEDILNGKTIGECTTYRCQVSCVSQLCSHVFIHTNIR